MKLLLTGGTGFFGRALIRHQLGLKYLPFELSILSRDPARFLAAYPEFSALESITFLKGDIRQRDSLPWSRNFTHILHAATDATVGARLPLLECYDQIVEGTRNILDLA